MNNTESLDIYCQQIVKIEGPQFDAFSLWYNGNMATGSRKKTIKRPVFDFIRKPTAPASHSIGQDKPEEKVHPSRRKVKHKRPVEVDE